MRTRISAVFGIAAALLALTACRSSPDVAAYIGDTVLTEAQVTKLIDEYQQKAAEQLGAQAQGQPQQITRIDVVRLVVRGEVCKQLAAKMGFKVGDPEVQAGAPELVSINERLKACVQSIPDAAPVPPTDKDLREIFDNGVSLGAIPADADFDAEKGKLAEGGQVAAALGQRNALAEAIKSADVTVNPRYGTVDLALLSFSAGTAIGLPLGAPSVVVNRPVAPAPAPSQQPQQ